MINKWDIVSDKDTLNNAFISKTGFDPQDIQSDLYFYGLLTTYDNVTINGTLTTSNTIVWLDGNSDLANQAYTHISNNGSDHSFINQDVKTTSTPTFTKVIVTGDSNAIGGTTIANGYFVIDGELGIDGMEIAFATNGNITVLGSHTLSVNVNGSKVAEFTNDDLIVHGTVTADAYVGIHITDLPLKRWRRTKALTTPIVQSSATALTTIDASWTDAINTDTQVLVIVDGEINAPDIDYTISGTTTPTLTFTYDVPVGSVLDIIAF